MVMRLEKQTFLPYYMSSHLALDMQATTEPIETICFNCLTTVLECITNGTRSWTLQHTFCHLVTSSEFHYQSLDLIY